MTITKTPLRISYVGGGGTDFPEYYEHANYGAVVSSAVNLFIYVIIKPRYDKDIVVSWSQHERVSNVNDLKHELIKASLNYLDIKDSIEITTIADVDTQGCGLGSSSAVLVGTLNALHTFKGEVVSQEQLAREAIDIQKNILKLHGGIQDILPSVYGGTKYYRFQDLDVVSHTPVNIDLNNILLFKIGSSRQSDIISSDIKNNIRTHRGTLDFMVRATDYLRWYHDPVSVGKAINHSWRLKKELSPLVSNPHIDEQIDKLNKLNVLGCKLCGAGGSGYLLVSAFPHQHDYIKNNMDLISLPVKLSPKGSEVIYGDK